MAAARARWKHAQALLDSTRLVFIDETGANTAMTRLRGRCRKGVRLIGRVPHGHWKTTTFVAGLRCDAIAAPCVIDGPMDGATFRAYVEQCQRSGPAISSSWTTCLPTRWRAYES